MFRLCGVRQITPSHRTFSLCTMNTLNLCMDRPVTRHPSLPLNVSVVVGIFENSTIFVVCYRFVSVHRFIFIFFFYSTFYHRTSSFLDWIEINGSSWLWVVGVMPKQLLVLGWIWYQKPPHGFSFFSDLSTLAVSPRGMYIIRLYTSFASKTLHYGKL